MRCRYLEVCCGERLFLLCVTLTIYLLFQIASLVSSTYRFFSNKCCNTIFNGIMVRTTGETIFLMGRKQENNLDVKFIPNWATCHSGHYIRKYMCSANIYTYHRSCERTFACWVWVLVDLSLRCRVKQSTTTCGLQSPACVCLFKS